MTVEQVKEEAKKRFDKDLTDEQAQAWLEAHPPGELQDEELENVAGGGCGGDDSDRCVRNLPQMGSCPRCGCNEHYYYLPSPKFHQSSHRLCAGCKLAYLDDERRWAGGYGK